MKIRKYTVWLFYLISINVFSAASSGTNVVRTIEYPEVLAPNIFENNEFVMSHQFGFDQAFSYVSDLESYWTYSSLYYYGTTARATLGARVNSSHRYSTTAVQYELQAYPKLFYGSYAAIDFSYANQSQTLFPGYQYRVEGYFNLWRQMEFSIGQGGSFFPQFSGNRFFMYTASLGKYSGNYFFWVRPYYYTPLSNQLYEIGIRKTFNDPNSYLSLVANVGHMPDIGNLPPLDNLITMQQKGVALSGQVPFNQYLFLKGTVSYDHQVYPAGLMRDITTAYLGVYIKC